MSRLISELLGAVEPMFSLSLRDMEAECGKPNVDVRLTAEIKQRVRRAVEALGLDPEDTSPKELYHALIGRVERDELALIRSLGGSDPSDVASVLPLLKRAVDSSKLPKKCWALKHSVAKKMLVKMPPKNVMKQLGYRSVESMIKRENPAEILAGLRFAESPTWLKKFNQNYKTLHPSDFETRDVEIVIMDFGRWGKSAEDFVRRLRHNIAFLKEAGIIMVLPLPVKNLKGLTITSLPLLMAYINEIRLFSAYFKTQQVKPNFGDILVQALNADIPATMTLSGHKLHWRVIQRYFGKLQDVSQPEIFEPHLQPEDLHWQTAEQSLLELEPSLKFWHELDYAGVVDKGSPVSCNLTDVAISFVNNLPYEQRYTKHLQESLWNELFMRYMGQNNMERQVMSQLEDFMVDLDEVKVGVE